MAHIARIRTQTTRGRYNPTDKYTDRQSQEVRRKLSGKTEREKKIERGEEGKDNARERERVRKKKRRKEKDKIRR